MNAKQIIEKFVKFYRILIAPPKRWQSPKKSEILIYDACGAQILARYLAASSVEIIPSRGDFVNVPCLLRAAVTLNFWVSGNPIQAYTDAYIRIVSPRIVLTFIDNDPDFYTISARFAGIKTISLQNGTRDDWLAKIPPTCTLRVDYMLMHNAAVCEYYQRRVLGEAIAIGSLRNNEVKKLTGTTDDSVLFISQFHTKPKEDAPLYENSDGQPIFWSRFYEADIGVVKFLAKWCSKNNKILRICARGRDKSGPEFVFFSELLTDYKWEFMPASDGCCSYRLVDEAEIVVSVDSTLGYESLGRGQRTACFPCRGELVGTECRKFGWPADLPGNGPFWTNEVSENEYQRIMDYLLRVSDDEWEIVRKEYAGEVMEFDPENRKFVALLEQLLSSSEETGHA